MLIDTISTGAPEATSGFAAADGPATGDIGFTRVTPHGWRLADSRLPVGDPFRLLAFIEHRGDEYEVLQLGSGFEWHVFASFDLAVAFVIRTATDVARSRLHGDLAWIGSGGA